VILSETVVSIIGSSEREKIPYSAANEEGITPKK
jgi:hypothetical protein